MTETEWMARWITEFGDKITQFLQTYIRDRGLAEDLSQEVFVRLYRFHVAHPHRSVQAGWLYTTARRLAIDAHRHAERQPRCQEISSQDDGRLRSEGFEDTLATRWVVQQALDQLSRRDRECLWLFYYQAWTVPKIAAAQHISEMNARMRLHRARKHFAHVWRGENDDGS